MTNNIALIRSSLCSLGAHIGHLRVDAYQSLSFYVLGGRNFFIVLDLSKTVPMLKKALIFFEHLILHFGHAVFCYSSVVHLSLHLKTYFARIVSARNQSFSYWRWSPGCVTNYRYVFLRLVNFLFRDVRVQKLPMNVRTVKLLTSYNISFIRNYNKLWLWFLKKQKMLSYKMDDIRSLRAQFIKFFQRSKAVLLHKYISQTYSRNVTNFAFVRQADSILENNDILQTTFAVKRRYKKMNWLNPSPWMKGEYSDSVRMLPNFISLLLRLCYIIRNKFKNFLEDNELWDEEWLFNSLFKRMIAFWRAIIFFRFFKKTATLPDCLVMLNPDNSLAEMHDFIGVRLPIICVADTVTEISKITYPIPSNDDSIILLVFYFMLFLNACDYASAKRNTQYDLL